VPEHASISALPKAIQGLQRAHRSSPDVTAKTTPLDVACATVRRITPLRVPLTLANSRSRGLLYDLAATPLAHRVCLPRRCTRRESANRVSGWNVLGHLTFRGFSPSSPRRPLGLRFPPCRSSPCGAAASRISAVQWSPITPPAGKPADSAILRLAAQRITADGCVRRRRRCSRLRRVAPLLVVSPLRG
jgi:hypothetical protein